jgi:hypothetical protein
VWGERNLQEGEVGGEERGGGEGETAKRAKISLKNEKNLNDRKSSKPKTAKG